MQQQQVFLNNPMVVNQIVQQTGQKWRKCKRKQYNVFACRMPRNTVFANKITQPLSARAIEERLYKSITTKGEVETQPWLKDFLTSNGYYEVAANELVICGPVGELSLISETDFRKQYRFPSGDPVGNIPNDWFIVTRSAEEREQYMGIQLPLMFNGFCTVDNEVLQANNIYAPLHNTGDILVAPLVNGELDYTRVLPVNYSVFCKTYDLSVGGWSKVLSGDYAPTISIKQCKEIYPIVVQENFYQGIGGMSPREFNTMVSGLGQLTMSSVYLMGWLGKYYYKHPNLEGVGTTQRIHDLKEIALKNSKRFGFIGTPTRAEHQPSNFPEGMQFSLQGIISSQVWLIINAKAVGDNFYELFQSMFMLQTLVEKTLNSLPYDLFTHRSCGAKYAWDLMDKYKVVGSFNESLGCYGLSVVGGVKPEVRDCTVIGDCVVMDFITRQGGDTRILRVIFSKSGGFSFELMPIVDIGLASVDVKLIINNKEYNNYRSILCAFGKEMRNAVINASESDKHKFIETILP